MRNFECDVDECPNTEGEAFEIFGKQCRLCAGHREQWLKRRAQLSRMRGDADDLANYEIWLSDEVEPGEP